MVKPTARERARASALSAALVLLCSGVSCLPDPPAKAEIDVTVRGGPREVETADGFVLRFMRRVVIIGVLTSRPTGSGGSVPQITDLDAPPFAYRQLLALGERFVGVQSHAFAEQHTRGANVTEEDIDALELDDVGESERKRLLAGSRGIGLWLTGTIERRGGETWTFDVRMPSFPIASAMCGHLSADGIAPIVFETESHHTIEVEVRLERLFAWSVGPREILVEDLVTADVDGDHVISAAELAMKRGRPLYASHRMFEMKLDGVPLACDLATDVFLPGEVFENPL